MIQFDEPQRFAVQQEAWDPESESWMMETNSIEADRVQVKDGLVLLANTEDDDALVVSSENLISGWTSGVQ